MGGRSQIAEKQPRGGLLDHRERRMLAYDLEPLLPQRRKGPARRMEEMNERFVTPGIQREISNHRSNAQMVGAQHEADDNHDKLLERGFSREVRSERLDKDVHVFDQNAVRHTTDQVVIRVNPEVPGAA